MNKKQLQELREDISTTIFTLAVHFKDDYEIAINAPRGVVKSEDLYVSEENTLGYYISYNRQRNTVSLRGDLYDEKTKQHQEVFAMGVYHFDLTHIVDAIIKFVLDSGLKKEGN